MLSKSATIVLFVSVPEGLFECDAELPECGADRPRLLSGLLQRGQPLLPQPAVPTSEALLRPRSPLQPQGRGRAPQQGHMQGTIGE